MAPRSTPSDVESRNDVSERSTTSVVAPSSIAARSRSRSSGAECRSASPWTTGPATPDAGALPRSGTRPRGVRRGGRAWSSSDSLAGARLNADRHVRCSAPCRLGKPREPVTMLGARCRRTTWSYRTPRPESSWRRSPASSTSRTHASSRSDSIRAAADEALLVIDINRVVFLDSAALHVFFKLAERRTRGRLVLLMDPEARVTHAGHRRDERCRACRASSTTSTALRCLGRVSRPRGYLWAPASRRRQSERSGTMGISLSILLIA